MSDETKTEARESLRERLREAQENYDSMAVAHQQESERAIQFEVEAKRLREKHAEICERVSAAKVESDLLRIERDARAQERDAARAALSALRAERDEAQIETGRLTALLEAEKSSHEAAGAEVRSLRAEHQRVQEQAAAMRSALDASDGKVWPLARVLYEIETYPERDLESLRGALTVAARRVRNALAPDAGRGWVSPEEHQRSQADLRDASKDRDHAREARELWRERCEAAEAALAEVTEDRRWRNEMMVRFRKERDSLEAQLAEAERECEQWKTSCISREHDAATLSENVEALQAELAEAHAEFTAYRNEREPAFQRKLAEVTKERDSARKHLDAFDSRLSAVRAALTAAGVPDWEPYPEEPGISDWEKSLRSGGRCIATDERVRRLAAERDEARAALAASEEKARGMREALERIASHDCGCWPCRGQCDAPEAAAAWKEMVQEEAREVLAALSSSPAPGAAPCGAVTFDASCRRPKGHEGNHNSAVASPAPRVGAESEEAKR